MTALESQLKHAEEKNAELAARLEVRERIHGALVSQIDAQNRERQQEVERLQRQLQQQEAELQRLKERERHYVELNTLLKEELACPCCHQGVKIAPLPPHLLPKSMAAPSLLAHITTAKFVDGLPFTRQSRQFERLGVNLGPGAMALWINTIGEEKLPPLMALMHEAALAESVVHCDETTVQVLKSDKAPTADH